MPFITKSNSLKIIGKIDFNKTIGIKGALYKKPIPFFSQYEKNKLLGLKAFFENPDNFISEFYVPIPKIDLQKFVYEGSSPAYHIRSNCERLNSDFKNFEIPEEIRNRGNGEVDRFRKWFKSNLHLIDNLDIFTLLLNKEFKVNTSPQSIEFNNSGLEIKEDINLEELEERIDEYLKKEDLYTNQSSLEKKKL